ncbi:MAG: DNRLRE domain-containing protein [Candidatus Nanoarchaeia archaeon]|nr:DNRLRE domain-containing protein [Candidatus Nanoarchaeia archaeon]
MEKKMIKIVFMVAVGFFFLMSILAIETQASTNFICSEFLKAKVYEGYGSKCGDAKYDHRADLDKDKIIGFEDLMLFSTNYGNEAWCEQQLKSTVNPSGTTSTTTEPTTTSSSYHCEDGNGTCIVYYNGIARSSNTPECTTETKLKTWYCNGINNCSSRTAVCENGCKNGVCLEKEESKCIDSDNGKNYYVKGKTIDITGRGGADYCYSNTQVREYYCKSDGTLGSDLYSREEYVCENGILIEECAGEGEIVISPNIKKVCCEGLHGIESGYRNYITYCTAEVCGDGQCKSVENSYNCPEDCVETPVCGNNIKEPGEECDRTDDHSCPGMCSESCKCIIEELCIKEGEIGSMYDGNPNNDICCEGLVKIRDAYITNSTYSDATGCIISRSGFICTKCGNGICGLGENVCNCPEDCQDNQETEELICTDSDGGKNYYIKGTTYGTTKCIHQSECSPSTVTDKCGVCDPVCHESETILQEFYCGEDGYLYVEGYTCPNGCSDGACIEEYLGETETTKIEGEYIILNEKYPDDNYKSNTAFYTGFLPVKTKVRSLINFDLSSVKNAEIMKAELVINNVNLIEIEQYGNQKVNLHRVIQSWSFDTATWNNKPAYDTNVFSSVNIDGTKQYAFDVTSIIGYLIENNAGVLLKAENEDVVNLKRFDEAYLNVWYKTEAEEQLNCEAMGGKCRFLFGCKKDEIQADHSCSFWSKCCMSEEENKRFVDLSDYPYPFIENNLANFIMVLGVNSKAEDIIAATDILLSLVDTRDDKKIEMHPPILDTEIANIYSQNTMIVGGPCINNAAAELMGITSNQPECTSGFEEGKAKIKLFQGLEGQGDNVILLVAGYDEIGTLTAANVLSNYKDYGLHGQEVVVNSDESLLNTIVSEPNFECTPGSKKACQKTLGVCSDSSQTCTSQGIWPGCTAVSYGSDYEAKETKCSDNLDNDCDGLTDSKDPDCGNVNYIYPQDYGATGDGTESNPWANDCIRKAIDACPVGGTVYLKAGYYQLSNVVNIGKPVNIIGEGRGKTITKTANSYGFTIYAQHVTLKSFTMDGAAQKSGDLPVININGNYRNADYIVCEDLEVKNGIGTGIQNLDANHGVYRNIYVHNNGGHGMHPCGDTEGYNRYNTYENIYGWNNGQSTIDDRGSPSCQSLGNTYKNIYSTNDGLHGFAFSYQDKLSVTNFFVDGAGMEGTYMSDTKDSIFTNGEIDDARYGVFVTRGCDNIALNTIKTINSRSIGLHVYNNANVGNVYVNNCNFDSISDSGGKIKISSIIQPAEETEDEEEPKIPDNAILPQDYATGDGTESNPWANNCIKKAVDACPEEGTVYLKEGYYQLDDYILVRKSINIIGDGINKTIVKTADNYGFTISTNNVVMRDMTVDGAAQKGSEYRFCVKASYTEYVRLENLEVKNSNSNGLDFFSVNHGFLKNIYAYNNGHHGIHTGANRDWGSSGEHMYNTYSDIYVWNNVDNGFDDFGNEASPKQNSYNTYNNIHAWNNGGHGITLFLQGGATASNLNSHNNGLRGIDIWGLLNSKINNCYVELNGEDGVWIRDSKGLSFKDVITKNNILNGIYIHDSSDISFDNSKSYDDQAIKTQDYGLVLAGASDNFELINCVLSPNKKGEIYNPAGATITRN